MPSADASNEMPIVAAKTQRRNAACFIAPHSRVRALERPQFSTRRPDQHNGGGRCRPPPRTPYEPNWLAVPGLQSAPSRVNGLHRLVALEAHQLAREDLAGRIVER